MDQAAAISDATAWAPAAEEDLLARAERASLGELREACAQAKAAADPDPDTTYRRIHERRRLRRWRDRDGAEHLHAVGTKVDMAKIDQALKPVLDEVFNTNRRGGVREPLEAYTFDALVALAERRPAGAQYRERYLTVLGIDVSALVRGGVVSGETCEIAGLGPIPAARARELLDESILKLVITKGVDVAHVTHLGRGPNAAQKIALLWQQPVCSRQGCGQRARLEVDHRDAWAIVHRTELHNLDPLCHSDHDLKTRKGWALVDGTGRRPMVAPDDARHPKNRPRGRLAS